MELKDIVVVSVQRSPMGRFGGSLKDLTALELGGQVIRKSLEKVGLTGDAVSMTVFGNCRQAGNGVNPARIAAEFAGVPVDRFAHTVNCACPTGLLSAIIASQNLRLGDAEIVVGGGMESMSTMPHLLMGHRWEGFRLGDVKIIDSWNDTVDRVANVSMGQTAENVAVKYQISREDQDQFAYESHRRAAAAQKAGIFKDEIVPIDVAAKGKMPAGVFSEDESIRYEAAVEKMAKLKPIFSQNGTVTAGNACGMTDGAAAFVMTTRDRAKALGLKPLFSLAGYSATAVDNAYMGIGPVESIPPALKRAGLQIADVRAFEINEAFAATSLACGRLLKLDPERVNVNGGAIALGHPTGCSGGRLLATLYNVLKQRDGEFGVASLCGGGGVSCAVVIKRED